MRKVVYALVSIVLSVIAILLAITFLSPLLEGVSTITHYLIIFGIGLMVLVACLLLTPKVGKALEGITERLLAATSSLSTTEIISCGIGLIAGLIVASLVGIAVARIAIIGTYLSLLAVLIFGYAGAMVGYRKREDFSAILRPSDRPQTEKRKRNPKSRPPAGSPLRFWTPA